MNSVILTAPVLLLLLAALLCAALGSRPGFFAGALLCTVALVLLALARGGRRWGRSPRCCCWRRRCASCPGKAGQGDELYLTGLSGLFPRGAGTVLAAAGATPVGAAAAFKLAVLQLVEPAAAAPAAGDNSSHLRRGAGHRRCWR